MCSTYQYVAPTTLLKYHGALLCTISTVSFVALRRCPVFERTFKSCLLRFVEKASEALRGLEGAGCLECEAVEQEVEALRGVSHHMSFDIYTYISYINIISSILADSSYYLWLSGCVPAVSQCSRALVKWSQHDTHDTQDGRDT